MKTINELIKYVDSEIDIDSDYREEITKTLNNINLTFDKDLFFEIWDMFDKEQIATRKEYTEKEQDDFYNNVIAPKFKHVFVVKFNQDE